MNMMGRPKQPVCNKGGALNDFASSSGRSHRSQRFSGGRTALGLKKDKKLSFNLFRSSCHCRRCLYKKSLSGGTGHLIRRHLAQQKAQAIICNSGNANACTGEQGLKTRLAWQRKDGKFIRLPRKMFSCFYGSHEASTCPWKKSNRY